jgi:serpin B
MEDMMQSAKEFTLRRFPKLSRWIFNEAEADHAAAGSGLQAFSLGLNKRLADDAGRSGNLVYSPLSVYAALSLVATGARERTLDELLGVLGAPSRDALADNVRTLAGQALADRSRGGGPHVSFACGDRSPSAPPTATPLASRSRPSRAPSTSTSRSVQFIFHA